jgi:diguanylate cyclase (GGDEF)-like protein/PAS domain S-box-containing protein
MGQLAALGWIILSTNMFEQHAIMYAVLGAMNEAILHAKAAPELYQQVCDAAILGGRFLTAAVGIPDASTAWIKIAAVSGKGAYRLRNTRISVDERTIEGQGLAGTAFRSGSPVISSDFLADERTRHWHEAAKKSGICSAAAVPLIHGRQAIGVLMLYSGEKNSFDVETVQLLERMARNVSFGLDNFAREAERQRAEKALRASEEKYRAVLEGIEDLYYENNIKGDLVFQNSAMCRLLGYSSAELQGMSYKRYIAAEYLDKVFSAFNEVYRTGVYKPGIDWEVVRKDGSRRRVEGSVHLIKDADGTIHGFRGIMRDVTVRWEMEQALRESEEKYRRILDGIEDAYYEVDLKGTHLLLNPAFSRMLGYRHEEMLGKTNRDFQTPDMAKATIQAFSEVYRTGIPKQSQDWQYKHKNASTVHVEGSIHLMTDGKGNPTGFRGFFRDVTSRRRMEHALRESEEKYRTILENIDDAYYEVDLAGRLVLRNPAFYRIVGYSAEELADADNRQYQTPEMEEVVYKAFNEVYRTGISKQSQEWEFVHKNGSAVRVEGSIQMTRDATGKPTGFRGIVRDVTKRRREERLLALEHKIALELAETSSPRRAARMVIRHICESEQWDSGGYWVPGEEPGTLRLDLGWANSNMTAAAQEFYKDRVGNLISAADSYLKGVWDSGKPHWIADVRENAEFMAKAGSFVMSDAEQLAAFYVPVASEGKVVALLSFSNSTIREPDERLLQTVSVISSHFGQYLQRKKAEEVLRESEERFRALTNLSSDWYWEQDAEFRFTRMESHHANKDEIRNLLIGKSSWESGFEVQNEGGWDAYRQTIAERRPFRDMIMYRMLDDGKPYYISVSGEPVVDKTGQMLGYRGVSREITDQKIAEDRIQYLATHDGLTGLPNRVLFSHLLNNAISAAQRYGRHFAVLFIDLDRFKFINDTLGHQAGDALLKEITARFKHNLRASDVIARLGGDEFVVLVQEMSEPNQAAIVARKLLDAAIDPVVLMGQECRVTASIGIAMYPSCGDDEQSLMKNADIAMYFAKEEGKNNFQFYSKEIKTQSLERLTLEANLRHALERREFTLHYQAKLDLKNDTITGVEALLRWNNAALGAVSPIQFIPVAEESGLIVPIGKWVLHTACAQNVAWQRQGLPPICMAVNLSPRQFSDPHLLHDIAAALKESGMAPQLLELEITEGMVVHHPEQAVKLLSAIKEMGVRLAIDDFGTGYSSLGQLKNFPIDTLKVDRSFIRDVATDPGDKAITQAIIAMGKTLSLTVVAEGVETPEQAAFLRDHACDEMQGYYFSKPIAGEEFASLMRSYAVGKR